MLWDELGFHCEIGRVAVKLSQRGGNWCQNTLELQEIIVPHSRFCHRAASAMMVETGSAQGGGCGSLARREGVTLCRSLAFGHVKVGSPDVSLPDCCQELTAQLGWCFSSWCIVSVLTKLPHVTCLREAHIVSYSCPYLRHCFGSGMC